MMISRIIGPNGQWQSKPIVSYKSLGIRKTIVLLHKIANLAKYVQLYGVTSLMPGLRKR